MPDTVMLWLELMTIRLEQATTLESVKAVTAIDRIFDVAAEIICSMR